MEPKIRFKGFEGEWKKVKFLEIFEFLKNNSLSRAELSSKGDFINIHYGDILIKYGDLVNIQNEELTYIRDCRIGQTLYKMCSLQNGDIIIADAAEDYSVGKCSEIVNIGNNKVVSGLHTIPCRPLITFAQGYLGHYINSNSYHNQLLPLIQGSKISSISKKALSQTSVFVPSYEEQQTIASYFRILDAKLQASAKKVESLKKLKSASLVAMFPQNGESMPKVRFKGFEGEWSTNNLGSIFAERIESNENGEMLSVTMNNGIIRSSDNGRFDNSNSDKSKYKVVKIGDIAYNSMRMWQGASGVSQYEGIVSPAYTVVTPSVDVDTDFFGYLFKTDDVIRLFKLNSQGLTSDNWNLKYPAFSRICVSYPKSKEEQQAIASFFRSLDCKIALETARLEKLKQIKLACLDKMFV